MFDARPVVAVIGATGAQGGAVVRALADRGAFRVRAITRNPSTYAGPADEVVGADLEDPQGLAGAFAGTYGVFAMSNFIGAGIDEVTQGRNAVDAAVKTGVRHFVWSTLPNVRALSDGVFDVPHFTDKAKVDDLVRDAGFEYVTFVEAPFYFENLATVLSPQPLPTGGTGWTLPIPGDARVVHAGSITDLGGVVAGAFEHPDSVGDGAHLSSAAGLMSFQDFADTLAAQGTEVGIVEVPPSVYATFYPGADEMAQMMGYWAEHTYLGPEAEAKIAAARAVSTTSSTDFSSWAAANMPPARQHA